MVTLTSSAIGQVKKLIQKQNKPNLALRIGVRGGGCSGMTYVLDLEEAKTSPEDASFEQDGVKIVVDNRSLPFLEGIRIDYKETMMGAGFEFENPQAKHSCGCGTSFSV